jgi:hypothetical protein
MRFGTPESAEAPAANAGIAKPTWFFAGFSEESQPCPAGALFFWIMLGRALGACLFVEHDPEKWEPVFPKRSCSNKKMDDEHDSTQLNHALKPGARQPPPRGFTSNPMA